MTTEEKLKELQWGLVQQRYDPVMVILIEEKIAELEQRKIAGMMHKAMREKKSRLGIYRLV